jgi:hypothetical protein
MSLLKGKGVNLEQRCDGQIAIAVALKLEPAFAYTA